MARQSNTDFNVENGTREAYLSFIEGLRRLFGRRSSHNLPVCVEQFQQPIQFQNITLRTNTHSIILRIRMDNLYLVGYQIVHQQQQGPWFEFDNYERAALITDSTPLGFSGDYDSLQAAGDIEVMENLPLGQQRLVSAVNSLATTTGNGQNDRRTRARSLVVVIQMICESMRFNHISSHLTGQYNSQTLTISTWMLTLEHSWGTLSALLLRADAYPSEPFSLRNPIHIPGGPDGVNEITTIQNVIAVLGILLGLCFRPNRLRRAVPDFFALVNDNEISSDHEQCLLGRPLLEVFSVVVNDIDNESPGQLYGTILVTHGLNFEYIFDRSKYVPETIKPGESIFLIGPSKSFLAYDRFTIQAALFDYDRWSHDDEVSKDQITWNTYDTTKPYNVPLSTELKGHYGKVTVNYMVLTDAVAARISITLKDGDGESTAQVYGDINTRIGDWNGENQKTVLFHSLSNNYENVREGYTIPLRRSVVAVPTNSSLRVIAKLYDHDVLSRDDEIANNTAVFPAQLSGSSEQLIYGKHGHIKVTVIWNFDI